MLGLKNVLWREEKFDDTAALAEVAWPVSWFCGEAIFTCQNTPPALERG